MLDDLRFRLRTLFRRRCRGRRSRRRAALPSRTRRRAARGARAVGPGSPAAGTARVRPGGRRQGRLPAELGHPATRRPAPGRRLCAASDPEAPGPVGGGGRLPGDRDRPQHGALRVAGRHGAATAAGRPTRSSSSTSIPATSTASPGTGSSYPDYLDLRSGTRTLAGLVGYVPAVGAVRFGDRTRALAGEAVTGNYFQLLGVPAVHGRTLLPDDDRPGSTPVVVISSGLWSDLYGEDPEVIGRSFRIGGRPYTIVGVAPEGFGGLTPPILTPAFWMPMTWVDDVQPTVMHNGSPAPGGYPTGEPGVALAAREGTTPGWRDRGQRQRGPERNDAGARSGAPRFERGAPRNRHPDGGRVDPSDGRRAPARRRAQPARAARTGVADRLRECCGAPAGAGIGAAAGNRPASRGRGEPRASAAATARGEHGTGAVRRGRRHRTGLGVSRGTRRRPRIAPGAGCARSVADQPGARPVGHRSDGGRHRGGPDAGLDRHAVQRAGRAGRAQSRLVDRQVGGAACARRSLHFRSPSASCCSSWPVCSRAICWWPAGPIQAFAPTRSPRSRSASAWSDTVRPRLRGSSSVARERVRELPGVQAVAHADRSPLSINFNQDAIGPADGRGSDAPARSVETVTVSEELLRRPGNADSPGPALRQQPSIRPNRPGWRSSTRCWHGGGGRVRAPSAGEFCRGAAAAGSRRWKSSALSATTRSGFSRNRPRRTSTTPLHRGPA